MIKNFTKDGKHYAKDTVQNGFSIWICTESIDGFNSTRTQRKVYSVKGNTTRQAVIDAFSNGADYDEW